MQRLIYLRDLEHVPTPPHKTYSPEQLERERVHLARKGLRYDNATGVVSIDGVGWIARPSSPSDHEPMETEADVLQWQFMNHIANSASRVARGFPPSWS